MKLPSPKLRQMNVQVGQPFLLAGAVADSFDQLRAETLRLAGVDFLSVCGDMFRASSFVKNNPGSVTRSLHKCGVCFDYNQAERALVLVPEIIGDRQYWRTYLRVAQDRQMPSESVSRRTFKSTSNAGPVTAWLLDFTALAASYGWERIPAQTGWQRFWQKREFWHYEHAATAKPGYDALMKQLYG